MSKIKGGIKASKPKSETTKMRGKTKANLVEEVTTKSILIDKLEAKLEESEQLKKLAKERVEINDHLVAKLMDVELQLASSAIESKRLMATNIIKTHMTAGGTLALLPVPLFDLAALTGTQLSLLRSLSQHYGVDFDEQKGKVLLGSLISSSIPLLTVMGLSSFSKLIPGIGTIGGSISMTILTSSLIYATGQVFVRHFEEGGTLTDFQGKYWKNFFTEQFEGKKEEMKHLTTTGNKKSE